MGRSVDVSTNAVCSDCVCAVGCDTTFVVFACDPVFSACVAAALLPLEWLEDALAEEERPLLVPALPWAAEADVCDAFFFCAWIAPAENKGKDKTATAARAGLDRNKSLTSPL